MGHTSLTQEFDHINNNNIFFVMYFSAMSSVVQYTNYFYWIMACFVFLNGDEIYVKGGGLWNWCEFTRLRCDNPQYTCIMGTATLWFITSGLTITTGIEVTNNPIRSTWPWSRHFLLKLTTAISWRPKKRSGVDVIKLFFGRKCKFPRNEEIEKNSSDVWTSNKMWRPCQL